eukprot:scpid31727/ scgid29842/ 
MRHSLHLTCRSSTDPLVDLFSLAVVGPAFDAHRSSQGGTTQCTPQATGMLIHKSHRDVVFSDGFMSSMMWQLLDQTCKAVSGTHSMDLLFKNESTALWLAGY